MSYSNLWYATRHGARRTASERWWRWRAMAGDGGRWRAMAGDGAAMAQLKARRGGVSWCGRADPPRGGRVQPGDAQRGGVRGGGGLNGDARLVLSCGEEPIDPSVFVTQRASFRRVWCGSTRSNPHSRHTEYSMPLSEKFCPLYWYVSFEYAGSHGVGRWQMGQFGDFGIGRCSWGSYRWR